QVGRVVRGGQVVPIVAVVTDRDGVVVIALLGKGRLFHGLYGLACDVVEVALGRGGQLGGPYPGGRDRSQPGLVRDDLGVVGLVGHVRDGLGQGVQVQRTTHPGGLATLGQFGVDRDRVMGCALVGQGTDRVEDELVGGAVEVDTADEFDDPGHCAGISA